MIKVLGFDISSSCCGWGLLEADGQAITILEHGNIRPAKKDGYSIIERLDLLSKQIDELCIKTNPDYIVIEDIIQFMKNKTSANTIITLSIFNRSVALQAYRSTKKLPIFLLPISIRTYIKKYLKMKAKIDKEDIPGILQQQFGKSFFKIVRYKKHGKNKGQPVVEVFDEADACAAAWAGIIKLGLIKNVGDAE